MAGITPDTFIFVNNIDVELNTISESDIVTIAGIDAATPISIVGGEYSIDGGTYTSVASTIDAGQTVSVRLTSSVDYATISSTELTVGDATVPFTATTRIKDVTPATFSFTPVLGIELNTTSESNIVTISGIDPTTEISIIGGEYSIDSGTYTSVASTIDAGQTVRVRLTSSSNYATISSATLTIGNTTAPFIVTTRIKDVTPATFSFTPMLDIELNTIVESNIVTITEIDPATEISIIGGEYSIDSGTYTSVASTIDAGQTVSVRLTSSVDYATISSTELTVGDATVPFTATTRIKDVTPATFSFTPILDVELNTTSESNIVTITEIDPATAISIVGGEYSIDGGTYTSAIGTIDAGQTVRVRMVSSDNFSDMLISELTIGDITVPFSSMTVVEDKIPYAFSFNATSSVAVGIIVESNIVTIDGTNSSSAISIVGGEYSIDGGTYTSSPGSILPGQSIQVRLITSSEFDALTEATLTIEGVSATFSATTIQEDVLPDAFDFTTITSANFNTTYMSNEVVISGINSPSTISITNGTYSINGGSFTAEAGTINNGQSLKIRVLTKSDFSITTTAIVTIGEYQTSFTVITHTIDTIPNDFVFDDVVGAQFNTTYTSKNIQVVNINSPSVVSIVGGQYSIDNGAFINAAGLINNGQKIKVRVNSASAFNTQTAAVLSIGSKSESYTVTTMTVDSVPEQFYLLPLTKAQPNADYISNEITIYGTNTSSPISIVGGSYSINNGIFINTPSNVAVGQKIKVKLTTTELLNANNTATLTIGGVISSFVVTTAMIDTTPNAFYLVDINNVALNAPIVSNPITISGINTSVPISIIGGTYSINGAAYTSEDGSIVNGQVVTVRLISPNTVDTSSTITLNIGGFTDTFTVTTAKTNPDQFYFEEIENVQLNSTYASNAWVVNGLTAPTEISIIGGAYSINSGSYLNTPSMVTNGQIVNIKLNSSPLHNTQTTAILTIGNVSAPFTITTVLLDTIPNRFAFNDLMNVNRNAEIVSNSVVISGITAPVPISIINGTYSVNGGEFTSNTGTVTNNQAVVLRTLSSEHSKEKTTCTVNIGGLEDSFSVTTVDVVPDAFYFNAIEDVQLNSLVTSNACVVTGLTSMAPVTIVGGEYSINTQPFTSTSGVITNLQTITVRGIASHEHDMVKTITLSIGGISSSFNIKTMVVDTTPNPFSLIDLINVTHSSAVLSSPITITGITAPTPISIVGGAYSIGDGAFVSEPGLITNNQKVTVKLSSSSETFTTTTAILTIGGFSEAFSITTTP